MARRKPQHALVKLVAQAAQHALTDLPLLHVDMEFEPTIDQDKSQKSSTQQKKIRLLGDVQTEKLLEGRLTGNSVYNILRYL
jgi:hypothetical protein